MIYQTNLWQSKFKKILSLKFMTASSDMSTDL